MILIKETMGIWDIKKVLDKTKIDEIPILRITSPIRCPFRQKKQCQIQIIESCSQLNCDNDVVRPTTCPFENTFLFIMCEE